MAEWIITKDFINEGEEFNRAMNSYSSENAKELLTDENAHTFRMYDDDGELYYEGLCSDADSEEAFEPLDDFGEPDAGCTEIRYKNKQTQKFETL